MPQSTSSAEPSQLYQYASRAFGLDHHLAAASHPLRGALQHFESTCREPSFRLSVSHVAEWMAGHARAAEVVERWVETVSAGFEWADRSGIIQIVRSWLREHGWAFLFGRTPLPSPLAYLQPRVVRTDAGGIFSVPAAQILAMAQAGAMQQPGANLLSTHIQRVNAALGHALLRIWDMVFVARVRFTWELVKQLFWGLFQPPATSKSQSDTPNGDDHLDGVTDAPALSRDPKEIATDEAGLRFIAEHEGMRLKLYNDPVGHCTIGVGHLVHHGPCNGGAEEAPFLEGITEAEAFDLLKADVSRFESAVQQHVKVPLTQNQFNALVSFAFNVGVSAFVGSDLLKKLNDGDYASVSSELARWDKANGTVLPGLAKRRKDEANLFSPPKVVGAIDVPVIDQTLYSGSHPGAGESLCSAAALTMALQYYLGESRVDFDQVADELIDGNYLSTRDGLLSGDYLEKYVAEHADRYPLDVQYAGQAKFDANYLAQQLGTGALVVVTVPNHYTLVTDYRVRTDGSIEFHMNDSYRTHWSQNHRNAALRNEWLSESELRELWNGDSNSGRHTLVSKKSI